MPLKLRNRSKNGVKKEIKRNLFDALTSDDSTNHSKWEAYARNRQPDNFEMRQSAMQLLAV